MFTGLIKDIGVVKSRKVNSAGIELAISSTRLGKDIAIDDSVAVNGVCQTVTKIDAPTFWVQVVATTLEKSNLGSLQTGDQVNLELAARPEDRLGGHIVQGHVNGIGVISGITPQGNSYLLKVTVPPALSKYIVDEGSIAIDGVSLTVAKIEGQQMSCAIIPHTWNNTVLCQRRVGDKLNLEVDILAKYVEKLLCSRQPNEITEQWLQSKGF